MCLQQPPVFSVSMSLFLFLTSHTRSYGEGNGNPPQYSCLENPVDSGAWWAAVHRVAQSWTLLKWLSVHACIGEGNGNPLQCSCLENPRDGGAWWAAIYGVTQSRTRLKRLSSNSSTGVMKFTFLSFAILHIALKWEAYRWLLISLFLTLSTPFLNSLFSE